MYKDKEGLKLNIGSGSSWKELQHKHGFTGIDIHDYGQPEVWDTRVIPWKYKASTVDAIRASHFFEHLTPDEAIAVLNECWRVLKPKGQIHIIIPNAWKRQEAYVLTHRSFWTEATFQDLKQGRRWEVYAIRRWEPNTVVTNKKGDTHAYLSPLDK